MEVQHLRAAQLAPGQVATAVRAALPPQARLAVAAAQVGTVETAPTVLPSQQHQVMHRAAVVAAVQQKAKAVAAAVLACLVRGLVGQVFLGKIERVEAVPVVQTALAARAARMAAAGVAEIQVGKVSSAESAQFASSGPAQLANSHQQIQGTCNA